MRCWVLRVRRSPIRYARCVLGVEGWVERAVVLREIHGVIWVRCLLPEVGLAHRQTDARPLRGPFETSRGCRCKVGLCACLLRVYRLGSLGHWAQNRLREHCMAE